MEGGMVRAVWGAKGAGGAGVVTSLVWGVVPAPAETTSAPALAPVPATAPASTFTSTFTSTSTPTFSSPTRQKAVLVR
eukprot:CAMPEP_0173171764 /NCGR_PEP_ID=MMETSP1141-20130122/1937_1 /TAXON_ID=483371 /ORGANISM="non described non described, Strain CCMP2298" /LENGTH=77 /DNA_ID=CAMNT_0014093731 /DNA_START=31 /DNA_END=267 /DNA_ORIENTATION=-